MNKYLIAIGKVAAVLLLAFIFNMNLQVFAETIFGPNVQVNDANLFSIRSNPSVAVDLNGNIYVAWNDTRNGNYDIYFAKSTDSGILFDSDVRVDDTDSSASDQFDPSIAIDQNGNIYVVWFDSRHGSYAIYFAKSTDGGTSFGPNIRVDDAGSLTSKHPSIAIGQNGNIYVVWEDIRNRNWDIYFAKSTDGGASFTPNIRVDDTGSSITEQIGASIAVDPDGNIYVTWNDRRNGYCAIYFAKSTDGGASFGPNIRVNDISSSVSDRFRPSIAVDPDGNIYVTWIDWRNGNWDVYFAKSTDGGASFGPNIRVDDTDPSTSSQENPSIAVDPDGNIYVVWDDSRNNIYYDIYFAKSTDGGASFEPNIQVNDVGLINNYNPSIAVDPDGNIYVVWSDSQNIYFARSVYQINMTAIPWHENIPPYYSTGAATSQMILNYIREGAQEPLLEQDEIYEYARDPEPPNGAWLSADEVDKALGHFDPYDYLVSNSYDNYDDLPGGNPYQGYNFSVDTYDPLTNPEAINEYMRDICHWMAYLVTQENWQDAGELVARPNTPAAIPLYGTYGHWVAVQGFAASENPCPEPHTNPWNSPDFTVFGFWMKDPQVSGIGQDTYKTAAECELTYFQPLTSDDAYNGLFLQVAEPPAEMSTAKVKIAKTSLNLANLQFIAKDTATRQGSDRASLDTPPTERSKPALNQQSWQDLVDPYLLTDPEATAAFTATIMGRPTLVNRLDIENSAYYLLPFKKEVKERGLLTQAVIILDAKAGYFKEAGWTETPEKLLKVNQEGAIRLFRSYLSQELAKELRALPTRPKRRYLIQRMRLYRKYRKLLEYIDNAEAELVWQPGSYSPSPYQPYWKIDTNGYIWYVTQEGKVASELKLSRVLNEIENNTLLIDRIFGR